MKIIYVLIPLSLMLLGLAVWAFFWAVRNDQFEDLDTPAMDILDDDEETRLRSESGEDRGEEKYENSRKS
jgi:cbb3-type cytochrome oxidase maturation protein